MTIRREDLVVGQVVNLRPSVNRPPLESAPERRRLATGAQDIMAAPHSTQVRPPPSGGRLQGNRPVHRIALGLVTVGRYILNMAQDLAVDSFLSHSESLVPRIPTSQPRMKLRSRIRGRERWYVDILEDDRRLAAAVELVLQTEEGVHEARVNPITGRVLVRYDPRVVCHPIESLLGRALEASPLSREEFSIFRSKPARGPSHRHLIAAKIACCLIQTVFLGGLCRVGIAGAALLFLVERASHASGQPDHSESVVTN